MHRLDELALREDMSETRAPFAVNERELPVCDVEIARKTPQRHPETYLNSMFRLTHTHHLHIQYPRLLSDPRVCIYIGTFPSNTRNTVNCLAHHLFIDKCRRLRQQPIVATLAHRLSQRHSPNASCRRARSAIYFPITTCVHLPSGHHPDHSRPRTWCS